MPLYRGNFQYDSYEFINYFLEYLHQEMKKDKPKLERKFFRETFFENESEFEKLKVKFYLNSWLLLQFYIQIYF